METLQTIMLKIAEFSDEKFGKDRAFTAPLHHLKKEVDEAIESGEIEEFVDILLLLLDAYRKRYPDLSAQVLLNCCQEKIEVLWKRKWKDPDINGVCEHIK